MFKSVEVLFGRHKNSMSKDLIPVKVVPTYLLVYEGALISIV